MKVFVVLALVALVQGRPEAGYSYNAPNRGGGGGAGGVGFGTQQSGFSNGIGGGQQSFGSQQSFGGSSGFNSGSQQSFGVSNGFSSGGSVGGGFNAGFGSSGSGSGFGGSGSNGGFIGGSGSGSNGGFIGGSGSGSSSGSFGGSSFGGSTQGQTIIKKHIYVHVAPPEPEEERHQQQLNVGVPQKHYKIIFIKAPSAPSPSAAQLAVAAQNSEKTIVYVLVKKPEDYNDVSLPAIAPTQPSKPEVYFIKYKTNSHSSGNTQVLGGSADLGSGPIIGGGGNGGGSFIGTSSTGSGSSIGGGVSGGGAPHQAYGPPGQTGGGPY